jgi:hypothetical protein
MEKFVPNRPSKSQRRWCSTGSLGQKRIGTNISSPFMMRVTHIRGVWQPWDQEETDLVFWAAAALVGLSSALAITDKRILRTPRGARARDVPQVHHCAARRQFEMVRLVIRLVALGGGIRLARARPLQG